MSDNLVERLQGRAMQHETAAQGSRFPRATEDSELLREAASTIEALRAVMSELDAAIDTLDFNSRHLIAEDTLQDAWKMLDMAREQMAMDADRLCVIQKRARALSPGSTEGTNG